MSGPRGFAGARVMRPRATSSAVMATRATLFIHEGETIDEAAFKALIQAAVKLNLAKKKSR